MQINANPVNAFLGFSERLVKGNKSVESSDGTIFTSHSSLWGFI